MRETGYAKEFLPRLFSDALVQSIPRGTHQTPDLLVTFGGKRFLIEEKEKLDSKEFLLKRSDTLASGKVHEVFVPQVFDNTLDGIIEKAARQISASGQPYDFGLVWITAAGVRGEAVFGKIVSTLYGMMPIMSMELPSLVHCYFYRNSSFFRCRKHVDGAVVAHVSRDSYSCKLLVNSASPKYSCFVATDFVSVFKSKNAATDPVAEEADNNAFVVDPGIDRKDEAAVIRHLQDKYSLKHVQPMPLTYVGGEMLLPPIDE